MSGSPPFGTVPLDLFDDADLLAHLLDDDLDGPGEEQTACCGCLRPAGPVPIRIWRTKPGEDGQEQVADEWAVCGDCIRKRTAAGMTLQQALADVVGARADVP